MIDSNEGMNPSLAEARRKFPFFYDAAAADEDDVVAMDLLVLMLKAYDANIQFPRPQSMPELCASIERAGVPLELNFMSTRRMVSECRTFQCLDCGQQQQIADALFNPFGA